MVLAVRWILILTSPTFSLIWKLITPIAVSDGFTSNIAGNVLTISDSNFQDGDAGQATVQFRVRTTLTDGATVPLVNIVAEISDDAGEPIIIETPTQITINDPTPQWSVNKSVTSPSVGPTVNNGSNDAYVRYSVNYCADTGIGNEPVTGAVLVDELPNDRASVTPPTLPQVTVDNVSVSGTYTSYNADNVLVPNGDPTGIYIVWELGDLTSDDGCISRTVEYEFPDANYAVGDIATNTVRGYYDGVPTDLGECVTNCFGFQPVPTELQSAQGEPNPFKSISDARPIAFPGVADYSFGFNTNDLNVRMNDIIIGDTLPIASDSRPAIEVYQVSTGTWDNTGIPDATLRIFFESGTVTQTVDGTGQTFNYGGPTSYVAPRTAGNLITRVEIEFPEVPPEFTMSGVRLDFTPRDSMAAGDYTDGTNPYRDYENCAVMSYTDDGVENPPAPGGFNDACSDARITDQDTSVVNWNKSVVGSDPIDNESIVEFSLNLEYTDQSSGNLPTAFTYTDTLDGVLDFVDDTETFPTLLPSGNPLFTFTENFDPADTVPTPYLRVEYGGAPDYETTLTFIWTNNASDLDIGDVYNINGNAVDSSFPINPVIAPAPQPGDTKTMTINFKTRVKSIDDPSQLGRAGTYTNTVTFDAGVPELACQGAPDLTEECDANVSFTVREVAEISAFKWTQSPLNPIIHIRPDRSSYNGFELNPNFACSSPVGQSRVLRTDLDGLPPLITSNNLTADYSRSPCAAQANSGETYEQILEITNDGNIDLNEFILYDILPHIGDNGISQATTDQDRLSEFEVWLADPADITPAPPADWEPVRVQGAFGGTNLAGNPITVIEYSTSTNPCRPEMSNSSDETDLDWMGTGANACDSDWFDADNFPVGVGWHDIRSFRVVQDDNNFLIPPSGNITIEVTSYIPTHDELDSAGYLDETYRALTGEVAWNNYAYRFSSDSTGRRLLTAEPRKSGIRVPERLSVGNRVWIDDGTNTEEDDADDLERDDTTITNPATTSFSDEIGQDNVILQLYRWDDDNITGTPPAITGASLIANTDVLGDQQLSLTDALLVAETTTANAGYYLFEVDQRAAGDVGFGGVTETAYDWIDGIATYSLRPGRYFVYVAPANFATSGWTGGTYDGVGTDPGPLHNFISSNGVTVITNEGDDLDRGIDEGIDTIVDPPVNGVVSDWFDLEFDDEPIGEEDTYNPTQSEADVYGPFGRGNFFQRDDHSNLTVDFGFIKPMALGNRIWIDDGRTTELVTYPDGINRDLKNDGIFNGDELALDNVVVELYRDEDNNGTIDVGDPADLIATTTTENGGYYLFPNLKPGEYIVHVADVNFANTGWGDNGGTLELGFGAANLPGPLYNYVSSTGWTTQQTTHEASGTPLLADFVDTPTNPNVPPAGVLTDNGVDETDPVTNGVSSETITLERDDETQAEIDFEAGSDPDDDSGYVGNQAVEDQNNDLTIDFAFVQPPMSIGNVVWLDNGQISGAWQVDIDQYNDGIRNGTETGIEGVRLNLYRDADDNGTPDDLDTSGDISDGDIIGWTVTNADGYYLFDRYSIDPDLADRDIRVLTAEMRDLLPGTYIIGIDPSNFDEDGADDTLGTLDDGVLYGYYSSDDIATSSDDNVDVDDNGLGDFSNSPYAAGADLLLSDTITIVPHGEPTSGGTPDETDDAGVSPLTHGTSVTEYGISTDGTQAGAIYTTAIRDDNSDRTWDFGFYTPMSLGNRVWLDMGGPTPGDGIFDADGEDNIAGNADDEVGIAGVTVQLFYDNNADGIPDDGTVNGTLASPGTPIATTTTDADGYYLFDDLIPTNYVVRIAPENFQFGATSATDGVLATYISSQGTAANTLYAVDPTDENGVIYGNPAQDDDNTDHGEDALTTELQRTEGVYSDSIALSPDSEPTTTDSEDVTGTFDATDGSNVDIADDNSDLTVDFGFWERRMSLGNFVWRDPNNDGIYTPGDGLDGVNGTADDEEPFVGVEVNLYRDDDGDGVPDGGTLDAPGAPLATTTTDANGFYLFDNLVAGRYIVQLDPDNWDDPDGVRGNGDEAVLFNYISTTGNDGDNEEDTATNINANNENGIDWSDGDVAPADGSTTNEYRTRGIYSPSILLEPEGEPTGEDTDNDGTDDDSGNGLGGSNIEDNMSDLTVDFGLYRPMSIGNIVWRDDGADSGAPGGINFAQYNDGIRNGDEEGIENVLVELFTDPNGDGNPSDGVQIDGDPSTPGIQGVLTDADGYYLYDGLIQGNYVVVIPLENFNNNGDPLRDLISSTSDPDPVDGTADDNDHGIDLTDNGDEDLIPEHRNNDTLSASIQLRYDDEPAPTNATDDSEVGTGTGINEELDRDSDLTVDFGFIPPPMSLGNRVWIDDGFDDDPTDVTSDYNPSLANDGILNGTEVGVDGVIVNLYHDENSNGVIDAGENTPIFTDITASTGYYLFDDLPPANYIVEIPADNFAATGWGDNAGSLEFGFGAANLPGPLHEYVSSFSTPDPVDVNVAGNDDDNTDHGIDEDDPATNGVISASIALRTRNETVNNDDEAVTDTDDNTPNITSDNNSDLTVDFGFFKPMSLGNRVWRDMSVGGGANVGDGIVNGTDADDGIPGVVVELYWDDDGDGVPDQWRAADTAAFTLEDPGTPLATTTTSDGATGDLDGYYLFDNLGPGNYLVRIAPENFQFDTTPPITPADDGVLARFISSSPIDPTDENAVGNDDDNTDHGEDSVTQEEQRTEGVYSDTIVLVLDNEPDTQDSELVTGTNNGTEPDITDANSDLTVDFGFWERGMSLGNFVWEDTNNDGVYDPDGADNTNATFDDERAFPGVLVNLFTDPNADGDPSDGTQIDADTVTPGIQGVYTDASGFYVYDNLSGGRYVVQIAPENWATTGWDAGVYTGTGLSAGPLVGYVSTTGNDGDTEEDTATNITDFNENGIDQADDDSSGSTTNEYQTNGILSASILLEPEGEALEEDTNDDGTDDPTDASGTYTVEDNNSDLTIDFGLYRPMSIGNIVWLDNGATATGTDVGQFNDGIRNGTEPGIPDVRVNLYRDNDGDGDVDGTDLTTPYRFTDTRSGAGEEGYYLFDGLPPGNYLVEIPTSNFATNTDALFGYIGSEDGATPPDEETTDDDNDHGIDLTDGAGGQAVDSSLVAEHQNVSTVSDVVELRYNTEPDGTPLTDDSEDVTGTGINDETDDNSDLTVDFGFVAPPMSIGNRVWFDTDNNSQVDGTDDNPASPGNPGIEDVRVELFLASQTPGVDTPIATDDTDPDGYYLFDDLPEGDYVVRLAPSNWTPTTGVLEGLVSSTSTTPPPDNTADDNDHGIDPTDGGTLNTLVDDYQGSGVLSSVITLSLTNELVAGDDETGTNTSNDPTNRPIADNNSDLTVDFGLYRPMSLGNRVWRDNGLQADGTFDHTERNNGIIDANEEGVDNVTVELFLDANSNGNIDAGEGYDLDPLTPGIQNTDITTNGGYYLFDGLIPGEYIVRIPYTDNFESGDPLYYHESSVPAVALDENGGVGTEEDDDSTDHGLGANTQITAAPGVRSAVITLEYPEFAAGNPESTAETDFSGILVDGPAPEYIGTNGETDANSDITVDFGFYVPPMSLGNRVWFDNDNNGEVDATDDNPFVIGANPAIEDVVVGLYAADGTIPILNPNEPTATATHYTVDTNADGYYLFDNLAPGEYVVKVMPVNFQAGGELRNFISSFDDTTPVVDAFEDNNDHGIDQIDGDSNGTQNEYETNGVLSPVITLVPRTEPDPTGTTPPDDDETFPSTIATDDNSDLTVDFGFYVPMSLGNVVWLDNGRTGATTFDPTQYNDGIRQSTELGIEDVTVLLFASDGTTPIDNPFVAGFQQYSVDTDADGYYLFDGLPQGDYIVAIPNTEFDGGDLNNLISSEDGATPPADNDDDDNDHGIDLADDGDGNLLPEYIANGVQSPVIVLSYGDEPDGTPLTDDSEAVTGTGRSNETDDNSDLTVDFGFVSPPLSLGNRVWFDTNNDGAVDGGDDNPVVGGTNPGIENVRVELYLASQTPGVDTPIATDDTDPDGYYLFDNLPEGDYVVRIAPSNFSGTNPLDGLISSTSNPAPVDENQANNNDDDTDHGIDPADGNVVPANNTTVNEYEDNGVLSAVIQLRANGEPLTDDDTGGTGTSNTTNLPIADNNSDLTVDFGFYRPMSLGNRVWRDNGVQADGTFNAAERNNGEIDTNEVGINGVRVELYTDPDGDGDPSDGVLVDFDITASGPLGDAGYYLFDGLTQGNYVVQIPYASNFDSDTAPLWYHESSVPVTPADNNGALYGNAAQDDDSTDHGLGADTQITAVLGGVRSASILLEYPETSTDNTRPAESILDTDLSDILADGPNSIGTNGETTANSDITVDFGFYVPPMSLGNRVWFDNDNNGVVDATDDNPFVATLNEPGIENVVVGLYRDTNGNNVFDVGVDLAVDNPNIANTQDYTVNTDSQGYYLFDNLAPADDYIVVILGSNFDTGGALENYISSFDNLAPADGDPDNDDHGFDQTDGVDADRHSQQEYIDNGVASPIIPLAPRTEPDGADDSEDVTGTDSFATPDEITDDNSDLTVDFGFYVPMSIGNRVWLDNGRDLTQPDNINVLQFNDGIRNGDELGIPSVTVLLFASDGTTSIDNPFVAGSQLYSVQTDAQGYYLFDGLPEGDYIVAIPSTQFDGGVLDGYISSIDDVPPVDADNDNNDHGDDPTDGDGDGDLLPELRALGIQSPVIELRYDDEPDGTPLPDDSEDVTGTGRSNETDDNSDLTVDFGFVEPPYSIGNRVWLDDGAVPGGFNPNQADDGVQNGDERGIQNVIVNLYYDANSNGTIDASEATAIDTDVTDVNGYYLFDNLAPGNYIVAIPNSEFDDGTPNGPNGTPGDADDPSLAFHDSSTSNPDPVDATADVNDHGIDTPDATYGILSPPITLSSPEATGEAVSGDAGDGPNGWGNNNEADTTSDLTVDFGFVRPMAIGNRVWEDISRQGGGFPGDGIRQSDEIGIGGVTVELYLSTQTPGTDTPIATTITSDGATDAEDGFYLFDRVGSNQSDPNARRLGPGDYIVHIPASQFDRDGADNIFGNADDGVLAGRINSDVGANSNAGDTEVDSEAPSGDENGQNTVVTGTPSTYPQTAGVSSSVITLEYDGEVASETDRDPNNTGDGVGVEDDNSELTVDFGFYNGVAIGNRVWFDRNRNGLIDPTETNPNNTNVGIPGVLVYLYEDVNRDGNLTGTELTPVAVDLTDSEGYYIFDVLDTNASTATAAGDDAGDLLRPGSYVVGIDPTAGNNSTVLANHVSTITRSNGTDIALTTSTDAERDNDDNGLDRRDVAPDPTIIYSEVVALAHFTETTLENASDKEAGIGDGRFNIRNESSDLTVDFGFFTPLSIGNRVWFDSNNDGEINPTETASTVSSWNSSATLTMMAILTMTPFTAQPLPNRVGRMAMVTTSLTTCLKIFTACVLHPITSKAQMMATPRMAQRAILPMAQAHPTAVVNQVAHHKMSIWSIMAPITTTTVSMKTSRRPTASAVIPSRCLMAQNLMV
jgi:hypothetical protein